MSFKQAMNALQTVIEKTNDPKVLSSSKSMLINLVKNQYKEKLIERTHKRIDELQEMCLQNFGLKVDDLEIVFNLKGKTAGMYVSKPKQLRFNKDYLYMYPEKYIDVVDHEFVHAVQDTLYKSTKPHGEEFYAIAKYMGLRVTRCHDFNIMLSPTSKYYWYKCDCDKRAFTSTRHRKSVKGISYRCGKCQKLYRYLFEVDDKDIEARLDEYFENFSKDKKLPYLGVTDWDVFFKKYVEIGGPVNNARN